MLAKTIDKPDLQNEYTFRAATMADLEKAVNLFNICAQAQIGADDATVAEIGNEWQTPGFSLDESVRVILTDEGELVGYVEVWDLNDPPTRIWVWGRVHPKHEGKGIGTYLMQWAENRSRQAIARVDEGIQVVMHSGTINTYHPPKHLFKKMGMKLERHFWRMVIDLPGRFPQPAWPKGITLKTFSDIPDLKKVYRAVEDAFQDHWGYVAQAEEESLERWHHWVENDSEFDPSLWFLALDDGDIAGVALCRPKIADDPDMGFVDTLGVRRPWRRQGLALALLNHSFAIFKQRKQKRVGLGVDAASLTGATKLYKKAGMQVARQTDVYQKILRSGKDISTQVLTDAN